MATHPLTAYQKKGTRTHKNRLRTRQTSGKRRRFSVSLGGGRVPRKALIDFTRSFALMMKARLSLIEALDTATRQCQHERFKAILSDVKRDVEGGKGLSESFSRHRRVFDPLYINLTRVGEVAGILDRVLLRIAAYQEKTEGLRRSIQQALAYPVVVMVVAVAATVFLLTTIVPTFAEMFADFGAELPGPTRWILAVSGFLTQHVFLMLAILGAAMGGVHVLKGNQQARVFIDRQLLRVPFTGKLVNSSLVARFCRTLGTLLESGVALVDALEIIQGATGNRYLDLKLDEATRYVRQGKSLHQKLGDTALFPELVVHMIMVGEQTGELDEMLIHAAAYYELEVDATLETVSSILEPVMIVLIGLVLGGILVALYLPMFDLVNAVG